MNEQQNLKLVQDCYAAFQRGDIQTVLNGLDNNIDWHIQGPQDIVPFIGHFHGKEQVSKFFAGLALNQQMEQFEVNHYIAQGDRVVALGHYRWKVKGTGRKYESDFAHVFTMRNGKEVAFQEYTDSYAAADAYQPVHAHSH
jgi:uncharacterized protein